jgi:hypothetical protein
MHGGASQRSDQGAFSDRQCWQPQLGPSPWWQDRDSARGKQVVAGSCKASERWMDKEQIACLSSRTRATELGQVTVHDRRQFSDGVGRIEDSQPGGNRP